MTSHSWNLERETFKFRIREVLNLDPGLMLYVPKQIKSKLKLKINKKNIEFEYITFLITTASQLDLHGSLVSFPSL
jgi:hypothetical protein